VLAERVKTWTEEWKAQGLREGMQRGEAKLLRRQLARRFGPLPPWADERLERASEAELEGWADRVLECRGLVDAFGGWA
jgi:hypothetical protein